MKKQILFIGIIVGVLSLASCKKCKTCQCWKSGIEHEEENCSYYVMPPSLLSTDALDTWEDYLVKKVGYDSVRCVTN